MVFAGLQVVFIQPSDQIPLLLAFLFSLLALVVEELRETKATKESFLSYLIWIFRGDLAQAWKTFFFSLYSSALNPGRAARTAEAQQTFPLLHACLHRIFGAVTSSRKPSLRSA